MKEGTAIKSEFIIKDSAVGWIAKHIRLNVV